MATPTWVAPLVGRARGAKAAPPSVDLYTPSAVCANAVPSCAYVDEVNRLGGPAKLSGAGSGTGLAQLKLAVQRSTVGMAPLRPPSSTGARAPVDGKPAAMAQFASDMVPFDPLTGWLL